MGSLPGVVCEFCNRWFPNAQVYGGHKSRRTPCHDILSDAPAAPASPTASNASNTVSVSGPPRVPEADEDKTPSAVNEGAPEDEHQPPPGTPAADTSEHPESQPEGSQASPPTTISGQSDATPLNPLVLKLLRFVWRVNGGIVMAEVDINGLLQLVVEPGIAPLVTSELWNCKDLERMDPSRGGNHPIFNVTHMSNNGRKKAWPLMMMLANISQAKRWGKAGHTLLALLPIPPSAMSAVEKVMLFQRCVTTVLQPLLDGMERPAAAIVTMVDPIANAGVADTLEAHLSDARKRHADGEYGTIPLLIVEMGIRLQWATEHPSCPVSPRPVRKEGGINREVDGGARVSENDGTKQRGVIKVDGGVDRSQARVQHSVAAADSSHADADGRHRSPLRSRGGLSATTHVTAGGIAPTYGYFKFSLDRITVAPLQGRRDLITWRESIEVQLEVAGLKGFADCTVPIPPVEDVGLRGEFRAAHLLTIMVISRCCSPVVQLALRSCRERLDAGHQAWHFILSTYQVRDDLYIAQLEEKMTHIRMGEQESATDYCNHA
ncbi:unnamed protein product [Closterium sp. NIES-54]